jgi:hypothetical protein
MDNVDRADPQDDNEYGTLTVEDDADGTTDPADLAGTATSDDAEVGYNPTATDADAG